MSDIPKSRRSYQSAEFWLSLAATVVGAILASGLLDVIPGNTDDQIVGLVATVLSALGYTVARTFQKASENKASAIAKAADKVGVFLRADP